MTKRVPEEPQHLQRQQQPGRIRAIVLAVLVHAAFFALIVFGVSWQSRPSAPVQAELWKELPKAERAAPAEKAEPKPEPPKPEPPKPEPPKPEPPKPEPPKPEPPKPEPPKPEPPKPEPPKPDPEIALKKEREKKERERLEQEKRERLERQKAEEKRQREQEEAARKKREQEEAARKKREDDKRRAEEEAAKKAAQAAAEAAAAARKSEFDGWVEKIRSKVRGRANVPDAVTGNPEAVFRVRILPGGEVLDIQIVRRSNNPAYDAAIERAIRSASPLPVPPANSELFPQFRELNLQMKHER